MNNKENERADFEQWHKNNRVQSLDRHGYTYANVHPRCRWEGWQARATLTQEDEEAVRCFRVLVEFLLTLSVCDSPLEFLRLWNEGSFDICRRDWPEAPEDLYPKQGV